MIFWAFVSTPTTDRSAIFFILNIGATGYLNQQAPENFASAATTVEDT